MTGETTVDGRTTRWRQHKHDRQQHIIEAAIAVIEEHPPGADVHVSLIAERAGMARPAVYRHFADRAALDQAIQRRALQLVNESVMQPDLLEGTFREALDRAAGRYISWAAAHPALHRLAVREASVGSRQATATPGQGPAGRNMVGEIAALTRMLLERAVERLDITTSEDDRAGIDLFVMGMVAHVVAVVRLWLARPVLEPSPEFLAKEMANVIWYQIDGLASARGVTLNPDLPVSTFLDEN